MSQEPVQYLSDSISIVEELDVQCRLLWDFHDQMKSAERRIVEIVRQDPSIKLPPLPYRIVF